MLNILLSQAEWTQIGLIIAWGVLLVLTVVVEAYSVELVSIWFSLGALVALILAIINVDIWIQFLVFTLVSIVSLIFGRMLFKKLLLKSTNEPSNAERLIGQIVVLITPVDSLNHGSGKLGDVMWTVAVHGDEKFDIGDKCIIDAIEGNKLIVSRKEN
ncbi:MAG: NfeD family protein [Bacilli bacterium]|jgi:membrane protein implicated in regulation of membrane protease activity